VDLVAEGRRRVEVAVAVVVGPARAHVHAASVVRTGGRLLGGAAPAGQRNDDRGQPQQHRGAGQDQRLQPLGVELVEAVAEQSVGLPHQHAGQAAERSLQLALRGGHGGRVRLRRAAGAGPADERLDSAPEAVDRGDQAAAERGALGVVDRRLQVVGEPADVGVDRLHRGAELRREDLLGLRLLLGGAGDVGDQQTEVAHPAHLDDGAGQVGAERVLQVRHVVVGVPAEPGIVEHRVVERQRQVGHLDVRLEDLNGVPGHRGQPADLVAQTGPAFAGAEGLAEALIDRGDLGDRRGQRGRRLRHVLQGRGLCLGESADQRGKGGQIFDALLFLFGVVPFVLVLLPHPQEQKPGRYQNQDGQNGRETGTETGRAVVHRDCHCYSSAMQHAMDQTHGYPP
jgi:hypothetical protein